MQSNVRQTVAACYERGMAEASAVAYVLIRHGCGELPPFDPRAKVAAYVADYYRQRTADRTARTEVPAPDPGRTEYTTTPRTPRD